MPSIGASITFGIAWTAVVLNSFSECATGSAISLVTPQLEAYVVLTEWRELRETELTRLRNHKGYGSLTSFPSSS